MNFDELNQLIDDSIMSSDFRSKNIPNIDLYMDQVMTLSMTVFHRIPMMKNV